jgi:pimeloyl-ACP methyl ester carboxylesterase
VEETSDIKQFRSRSFAVAGLLAPAWAAYVSTGCASPSHVAASDVARLAVPPPVVFHLPGIAGEMAIDRSLQRGLVDGGVAPSVQIVQWVGQRRGLPALGDVRENKRQANQLARQITDIYRQDPRTPIILTSHSGGTGVAVWALEALPDDVQIDTLVMLSSALSPGYDLSKSLAHVRRAISLSSVHDNLVLDLGTRTFGTIDRQNVAAAGYAGFIIPEDADPEQYAKLTQYQYDPAWTTYANHGDHIGSMSIPFARDVIAKWIQSEKSRQ